MLSVGSPVKFSQPKFTLPENQGVIDIDVVHIGVSEMSISVKLLLGNESNSSSTSATFGEKFQLVTNLYFDYLILIPKKL